MLGHKIQWVWFCNITQLADTIPTDLLEAIGGKAVHYTGVSEDGMDQSKWAIPRNRGTRASKSMSVLAKPKCKVQGVWCHGTLLKLFVLDPRVPSDSSTVIEILDGKTKATCFSHQFDHFSISFSISSWKICEAVFLSYWENIDWL